MIVDVVQDGSAETFIISLKKCISRKSFLTKMLTDSEGVFVGNITQKHINFHYVKWNVSLKEAPWYKKFWERVVEQLKQYLKKDKVDLICKLQTVSNEIELVLNSK